MSDPFARTALEDLAISRFIFHVVHDGDDEPVLLEEAPCEKYELFFLDLVLDSLKGTRYLFNEGSQTESILSEICDDPTTFQEKSCQLATNFHAAASGSASPGIFFVLHLLAGEKNYFAMVKYDNQTVLQYRINDSCAVTIDAIANTITQDRRALQKSALIYMGDDGPELIVRDRQASGGDIAHYFKGFLNVSRRQNGEQITRALHRAVVETVSKHAAELPPELTRDATSHFARTVQEGAGDADTFFGSYFGNDTDSRVRDTFDQQLVRRGINDCPFDLNAETAQKDNRRRFRTSGGITLQLPPDSQDYFEIEDCPDGEVEIRIRTSRVWES